MTGNRVKEMRVDEYRDRILNDYVTWMTRIVCGEGYSRNLSWRKLFRLLHATEFIYILELDGNRAIDGTRLRYRFADECGYSYDDIENAMEEIPCSVLEMMVALSLRCEEHIMADSEFGNRTGKWFFEMLESLGLIGMDDRHFDKIASADILDRFMRREYQPDGRGGLFTVLGSQYNMREDEIWYQMMHHLTENIYGRR